MKSIAYFLVACLLSLTSIDGMASVVRTRAMADCCKGISCKHGKNGQDKGCDNKACNRMASCVGCSFFVTEQLIIQDQFALYIYRSSPLEVTTTVTGYAQLGWHPPKV